MVRGISLVDQMSKVLFKDGVNHGVKQSGHWNISARAITQVASIDTLHRRKEYPSADLIIIDEADSATSQAYIEFAKQYPDAHFISVTATPFSNKDLTHIADCVVHPITVQELTDHGFLCKLRYFGPSAPDLSGIKTVDGDYENKELEKRMTTGRLTGDILSHWLRICRDRKTLCFAVNVRHSKTLTEMFCANGVMAEHIDASTPIGIRDAVFSRLKTGETKIVCNVGIATRGIDLPYVSCLIMARPTKSYSLWIQMLGRGTRMCPGKNDCIILDHSSGSIAHGFMVNEPELDILDPKRKQFKTISVKICEQCYLAYQEKFCPECGPTTREIARQKQIEVEEGELRELIANPGDDVITYLRNAKKIAKAKGYQAGWIYYSLIRRFGIEEARPHLPHWWKEKQ